MTKPLSDGSNCFICAYCGKDNLTLLSTTVLHVNYQNQLSVIGCDAQEAPKLSFDVAPRVVYPCVTGTRIVLHMSCNDCDDKTEATIEGQCVSPVIVTTCRKGV